MYIKPIIFSILIMASIIFFMAAQEASGVEMKIEEIKEAPPYIESYINNKKVNNSSITIWITEKINNSMSHVKEKGIYYGDKFKYPEVWKKTTRLVLIGLIFLLILNVFNTLVSMKKI